MVELCFWAIYRTSIKLAIYCDYLWYILHATKFYVPGLQYGKIVKPTVHAMMMTMTASATAGGSGGS
jgi:hypothetical protein